MSDIKTLIENTIKEKFMEEYQVGIKDSEALGVMLSSYFG